MATNKRTIQAYLIANAGGELRVVRRIPRLSFDEVAFEVSVSIPTTWGKLQQAKVILEMPEPPDATVTIADRIVGEFEEDA